jgi:hypothetical protein
LEASGKIGRLAYHRLLLGRSCSDQVADHNEARCDPDPDLQGRTGMRCDLRNRLGKIEPGANCALVSLRIAEIGQDAIAHVLCDKAAVALDHLRAAAMICADDSTQVLRIDLA